MITSIEYCQNADISLLNDALLRVISSNAQSILILGSDNDEWGEAHDLWLNSRTLKDYSLPIFGGVFPYLLYEGKTYSNGTLIIGLSVKSDILIIENMSTSAEWHDTLDAFKISHDTQSTLLTFVDGLANNIERITEDVYQYWGASTTTVGCGAGSLDFIQKPCIISPQGLLRDATLIAVVNKECGLGVNHGWETFAGPFLVTQGDNNSICTLNYMPALEVYKKTIEENSDVRFANQAFFDIAKTFPFGIASIDGDLLVRDPVSLQGDSLVCVGEVPQNSSVYLLRGKPELLVESAGDAISSAIDSLHSKTPLVNTEPSVALIFDCID